MSSTPYSLNSLPTGLTDLSPEILLEIASHINLNEQEPSPVGRDHELFFNNVSTKDASSKQSNLANLRLVCRYFSNILEHAVFESVTFHFDATHVSGAQVDSQLSYLSNGWTMASQYTKSLKIKQLDPYIKIPKYYGSETGSVKDTTAEAEHISLVLDTHLERAILLLQNLHSVEWNIDSIDNRVTRTMIALSSLPLLQSVTLQKMADVPAGLMINRLSGLHKFAVCIIPAWRNSRQATTTVDNFVDNLAEVVRSSPFLSHLIIVDPKERIRDLSFRQLTKNSSLSNLKSVRLSLHSLKVNAAYMLHFKSLTTLRVDGSAYEPCTGIELWTALTAAQVKLLDLTVCHLSDPLAGYLSSYSGLNRLHVLLKYQPHKQFTTFDAKLFIKTIIPLHKLSPSAEMAELPGSEGLIFDAIIKPPPQIPSVMPSWMISICMDSIPDCLSLLAEAITQSEQCRLSKLNIKLSSTMRYFGCGTGMMSYARATNGALKKWVSDLVICEAERYPSQISVPDRRTYTYCLVNCEHNPGTYVYQRDPTEKETEHPFRRTILAGQR